MTVYTDVALISSLYAKMEENITNFRSTNDRFLTLSEVYKINVLPVVIVNTFCLIRTLENSVLKNRLLAEFKRSEKSMALLPRDP